MVAWANGTDGITFAVCFQMVAWANGTDGITFAVYFQMVAWANGTDGITFEREGMISIHEVFSFCGFRGQNVACSDIADIVLTEDGFCYRISARKFPSIAFDKAGYKFGLIFQMNIFEEEYGSQAPTTGVGVKVKQLLVWV